MKKNNEYINGKYNSLALPICSLTIDCIEAYELSNAIDHLEGINRIWLLPTKCKEITKNKAINPYKAKLVKVKVKNPNKGAFNPIKLVTSNCSNGEKIIVFEKTDMLDIK